MRSVAGEPLPHHLDEAVVGHIHVERRYGDVAVTRGPRIGVGASGPGDAAAADPVDLLPPGVFHEGDCLAEHATAAGGYLDALHVAPGHGVRVEVQRDFP